jgi:hypothetical protein
MLTANSIADPPAIANIPMAWLASDKGNYELAARRVYSMAQGQSGFRGMPEAMDLASGATKARLALVTKEAETSLLSDTLNFPMPHVMGIRPRSTRATLRAPFKSDIRRCSSRPRSMAHLRTKAMKRSRAFPPRAA